MLDHQTYQPDAPVVVLRFSCNLDTLTQAVYRVPCVAPLGRGVSNRSNPWGFAAAPLHPRLACLAPLGRKPFVSCLFPAPTGQNKKARGVAQRNPWFRNKYILAPRGRHKKAQHQNAPAKEHYAKCWVPSLARQAAMIPATPGCVSSVANNHSKINEPNFANS